MTQGRGRPPHDDTLTPMEWTTVEWVRHGLTNRDIAARRGVTLDAVKFHVGNVLGKLGLDNRRQLRRWAGVSAASALKGSDTMEATPLGPIGQVSRTVGDIAAAEAWYRDVLGLSHLYTYGKLAFFDCGGVRLMIEDSSIGEVPNLHNDSVLYFRVADIQDAYDVLRARDVEFIGAPHMIAKHPDGTEEWMAFFKDSDGGLLALMSQVKPV